MNTNLIHNILNVLGLLVGAVVTFDWTALGASPATVKKHLERIHAKLGVETRTAAATLALQRMRQLHPGWT